MFQAMKKPDENTSLVAGDCLYPGPMNAEYNQRLREAVKWQSSWNDSVVNE